MPNLLIDMVIDRVDLVKEGANTAAFVEICKRKEKVTSMTFEEVIAKMKPEYASVITAELSKSTTKIEELNANLAKANSDLEKAESDLRVAQQSKAIAKGKTDEEVIEELPEDMKAIYKQIKLQKELAEKALKDAYEAEAEAKAINKAKELKSIPYEQDKLVKIIKNADDELIDMLNTVAAAIDSTVLEGEIGKSYSGAGSPTSVYGLAVGDSKEAWATLEKAANKIVADEGIAFGKAMAKAMKANPEVYKVYVKGGGN